VEGYVVISSNCLSAMAGLARDVCATKCLYNVLNVYVFNAAIIVIINNNHFIH
jgi:hypothetical protein